MPQEHFVLRCFSCETFQVHIVKKSPKWECKICGAKQSLKRNYGKGSAKDCRNQVMKLNGLRMLKSNIPYEREELLNEETVRDKLKEELTDRKPFTSKWTEYVENKADSESEDEEDVTNRNTDINKIIQKRKRAVSKEIKKNKKPCSEHKEQEISSKTAQETNSFNLNNQKTGNLSNGSHKKLDTLESTSKTKHNKYSKYLEEEERNENLFQEREKILNIFESEITDLDTELNF